MPVARWHDIPSMQQAVVDHVLAFEKKHTYSRVTISISMQVIKCRLFPDNRDVEINRINRLSRYKRARYDRIVSFSMYQYIDI